MDMRLFVLILAANAQDLEIDKRGWIDPTDMLNYDTVRREMKKPEEKSEKLKQTSGQANSETGPNLTCELEILKYEELKVKVKECEQKIAYIKDEMVTYGEEMPYMKRYVNQILGHFAAHAESIEDYKVTVQLTGEDKDILTKFMNGGGKLQEVDEILSRIYLHAEILTPREAVTTTWARAMNLELFIVPVVLCATWIFMLKASVFKWMLLFVLICTFWHWKHLYQQAVARRDAELAKIVDLPSECRPNESQSFLNRFGTLVIGAIFGKESDSCVKYYNVLGVDPIWEVSPSLAFSEAISQFATHPFGVLGTNIGTFYYNLNANLPWFSYHILMAATLFFAFFALIALCGYRIRLPFFMGAIEPAPVQIQNAPAVAQIQNAQVRQPIQDVRNQPQLGVEDEAASVTNRAICENCQCSIKPANVKRRVTGNLVHHVGAGDQILAAKRENVQEIMASCSHNNRPAASGAESGDHLCLHDNPKDTGAASAPTEISLNKTPFLTELRDTLNE